MFPQGLAQRSLCQFVAIIVDLADMAVPFLLVIFLGGAFADVMEIDVSQCDVESPSFLQLKHQGEQAEQDILQLLVTSAGISRPGVSQPGVVYKCNVTHNPDFSQDCADLTTGRIPAGVPFSFVWEVEVLTEPHRGFLAMSAQSPTNDGSIVQCPEVGPCKARCCRRLGLIKARLSVSRVVPASPNTWPKTQWLTSRVHCEPNSKTRIS